MESIDFKESNKTYAAEQPQYKTIRVLEMGDTVVICGKASFWERIIMLITGQVWLSLLMFGRPLTPSFMTVKKKDVIKKGK